MSGVAPGQDGGVVGEGHGRKRRHGPVPVGAAHVHEAGDVGGVTAPGQVIEHVGVGAVQEHGHDVAGPTGLGEKRTQHDAVLVGESGPRAAPRCRGAPEQRQDRGGDVDQSARVVDQPARGDAGTGGDERRPRLDDAQRPVLTEVATLVTPVMRRRMQDDEIGRRGVIEELCHVIEGVRIRIVVSGRVGDRSFRRQGAEVRRVLAPHGVLSDHGLDVVGPVGVPAVCRAVRATPETEVAGGGGHLVAARCR